MTDFGRAAEHAVYTSIRERFPDTPIAYGIDHRGPWARIGEVEGRAKPDCIAALRAALAKAMEPAG